MKRALVALFFLCVLATMAGCSKHSETVKKVNALMDQGQFVPALDELTVAIRQDPQSAELKRLRVLLLIRYERVDMAYAAYAELDKISPNDQVLMDALKSKDPKVREGAARVLGFVATPMAIQGLQNLLSDPDRDVRRATVAALGEIRDPRATKGLIAALKDEWWFVRSDAAEALGKIRDVSAAGPLFEVLGDSDSSVRLGAENSLLTLCRQPNAPHDVYVKYASAANPDARRVALLSLAVLNDHSVIPQLAQMLSSPDAKTRAQSVRALGILHDPDSLIAVRKMVSDTDGAVRLQAVVALGQYRDAESVGVLKGIADNAAEIPLVRRAAAGSLMQIEQAAPPDSGSTP